MLTLELFFGVGQGKAIEKTLPEQSVLDFRGVLGIVPFGGEKYAKCVIKLRKCCLFGYYSETEY